MSKRNDGEGTIVRRKDGRWQASLQVDGVRRTVYGKTQREARTRLRELQRERDGTGRLVTAGESTVDDLFEAWLEADTRLKVSTLANYRTSVRRYISPVLGQVRLNRLSVNDIQRLYTALPPSVAEKVHQLLHRAFEVAVLWNWMPGNPCDRVLKPAYTAKRKTLWSREELRMFMQATVDDWLHPLWLFLLGTGCRVGEALALSWDDVDEKGSVVNVTQTLHRIDKQWMLVPAKSERSERIIVLPEFVIAALGQQKREQAGLRKAAGSKWESWGLVFSGKTGAPLSHSTVQQALRRWCEDLDLTVISPHGMRHLHASLLLDQGVPITAVSARLGHASPDITMKIYAHALSGQDNRAAQAIGNVMRQVGRDDEPEETTRDDQ